MNITLNSDKTSIFYRHICELWRLYPWCWLYMQFCNALPISGLKFPFKVLEKKECRYCNSFHPAWEVHMPRISCFKDSFHECKDLRHSLSGLQTFLATEPELPSLFKNCDRFGWCYRLNVTWWSMRGREDNVYCIIKQKGGNPIEMKMKGMKCCNFWKMAY